MNCPLCKSKRVVPYSNKDLLLVVPIHPDVAKLTGFMCESPKCKGTFYIPTGIIEKGQE